MVDPRGIRELPASRYDLNTYFGRVRVFHQSSLQLISSIVWMSRIHGSKALTGLC